MVEKDLARIGEAFFEIEKRENLYEWKIGGASVWVLLRSRLFRTITQNSNLYDWNTAKKLDVSADPRLWTGRNTAKLLWQAVTGKAPKLLAGEPDYTNLKGKTSIVVPFATRDANLIDKFSKPISDSLGDSALVLGVGTWDKLSSRPRVEELNKMFVDKYGFIASVIVRFLVTKKHHAKYLRVVKYLEETIGAPLTPFERFPRWMLREFFAQRYGYRKIMKATSAKTMYMVNAARMPLQAAAQSLGIKIVEIQSGVFSKYSLQFSWPGSPNVDYIPNEIWTWGEYFTAGIEHAGNQTIRVVGSTGEFDAVREKKIPRIDKQVVFLSQPLVGIEILRAALAFAEAKPKLQVIIKLHPRNDLDEFNREINSRGGLPDNCVMIQNERSSLEVIAESSLAVGAFSTALIEAAGLGTKVALLKVPGWDHLKPLVDGGHAALFASAEELIAGLGDIPQPKDPYFFYGRKADIAALLSE
jgi:hypothetical protein